MALRGSRDPQVQGQGRDFLEEVIHKFNSMMADQL
jgi:hypothetical protein